MRRCTSNVHRHRLDEIFGQRLHFIIEWFRKLAFDSVTRDLVQKDHFKSVFRHAFNPIRSLRSGFLDETELCSFPSKIKSDNVRSVFASRIPRIRRPAALLSPHVTALWCVFISDNFIKTIKNGRARPKYNRRHGQTFTSSFFIIRFNASEGSNDVKPREKLVIKCRSPFSNCRFY